MGADLHCTEEGQGIPLVALHGGPGLDHTTMAPHLQPLSQHLRLIYFDHRGTGRSAKPQGATAYHIDRFVGDIEGVADTLELSTFALMGHSFGGLVALHFALAHPEMLTHLILVSTPVSHHYIEAAEKALPEHVGAEALKELASLQDSEPSDYVMKRSLQLLAPMYFREPERVSELGLDSVRFGPRSQAVWESLDGFDLRPRLQEIRTPTLVIAGRYDRVLPPDMVRDATKGLPDRKLMIMEKSGHYPFIEQREAFLTALMEFLGIKAKKGLFGRRPS